MAKCPACGRDLLPGATECFGCGVILEKYRPGRDRPGRDRPRRDRPGREPAADSSRPPPVVSAQPRPPRGGTSLLRALLVGSVLGSLVVGTYYLLEIRPRVAGIEDPYSRAEPDRTRDARARHEPVSDHDLELDLGSGPLGLVWTGSRFLACNRDDPWGFLEIVPDGADERRFTLRSRPVVERRFSQRVSFDALTWNGEKVVAATNAHWFQRGDVDVFTVHDPETLRIERTVEAPPSLGCLAFDGTSYWAATRKNTRDEREEAWLYRLDRDLQVEGRFEPPGVGCQGLAWDGELLWHVDVFDDTLSAIDIRGSPRVVLTYPSRLDYLSGIAHDGRNLWVAEYENDRLHRIHPMLRAAWHRRVFGSLEMTVEVAGQVVARQTWHGDDSAPDLPAGEFDGVWFGHEASHRPSGDTVGWTLMIRGGRFFVQGPHGTDWYRGSYDVVSGGRPAAIDFHIESCDCEDRGETSRSLYRLKDGVLVVAMAEPGAERPRSMEGAGVRALEFSR